MFQSPGVPGSSPAAAETFPLVHTYAVPNTVENRGIIMTTERITDSRRMKNVKKNDQWPISKLTCKRSIKKWLALTNKRNNKLLILPSDATLLLLVRFFRIFTAFKHLIYILNRL